MATTYGDRLLADAEERVRYRQRRRRFLVLLIPSLLILVSATLQTLKVHHDALNGVSFIKHALDHVAMFGYVTLLIAAPLYLAVGPTMNAWAAGLAALTGPVLMPVLFGPGWAMWQRIAIVAICMLVIGARLSQRRQAPATRLRGLRR